MQVSDSHKFIFFHIRRTGGTSIASALGKVSKDPFKDRHMRPSRARQRIPKKFKGYFKFSFVRNPWDRMVSWYSYDTMVNPDFLKGGKNYGMKFPVYLDYRLHKARMGNGGSECQVNFLGVGGEMLMDFVGRYEKIQEDFNKVCAHVGVPACKLPHVRKTNRKKYRRYYNDETRELIMQMFTEDVETFDYRF